MFNSRDAHARVRVDFAHSVSNKLSICRCNRFTKDFFVVRNAKDLEMCIKKLKTRYQVFEFDNHVKQLMSIQVSGLVNDKQIDPLINANLDQFIKYAATLSFAVDDNRKNWAREMRII